MDKFDFLIGVLPSDKPVLEEFLQTNKIEIIHEGEGDYYMYSVYGTWEDYRILANQPWTKSISHDQDDL